MAVPFIASGFALRKCISSLHQNRLHQRVGGNLCVLMVDCGRVKRQWVVLMCGLKFVLVFIVIGGKLF